MNVDRIRTFLPDWASPKASAAFLVGFAVLYTLPLAVRLDNYVHGIITQAFIFAAAALAWNWLGGYVGQISFGHAAMFGIGGFLSIRLQDAVSMPFWAAWIVGGLVAGMYALSWGHPTLRLRGPYFAIATIGVGEATRLVATFWGGFTGGSSGTSLPLDTAVSKYGLYWYALYFMAATIVLAHYLRKSRVGLGLLAIKEDVDAAEDVGVSANFYQDLVLFLSGTVVGIAGAAYASFFLFIEPGDMFGFERSISFLLMGVIGGIGTILGPVLGAVTFVILQEYLIASYPDLYLGLYGLLLIVVILVEPLGLSGLVIRLASALGYRPRPGAAPQGMGSPLPDDASAVPQTSSSGSGDGKVREGGRSH
jgi:branched-chain amino acid transport system permease protein